LEVIDESSPVDTLVVAVGHTEYRALSPEVLRGYCRHAAPVLTDVKSLYDRHDAANVGFTVFRL
jgi:UDP-N-acetyl-D-galactosamine dehydrogenase